jgi:two-component system, LytTR family, sensor kinase
MAETHTQERSIRWLWIAVIWCAGGLFDASQTVFVMHLEARHHPWPPLFGIELVSWLPWALATPLVIGLARRYPITRGINLWTVIVHLVAFAAVSLAYSAWSALLQTLFNPWGNKKWPTFVDTWGMTLTYQAFTFLIAYALILTVTYVVDARESVARQVTESARLNEELSRAQLAALRRQLEPHFMYNALNSIAGLVRDNRGDAAVSMIVGLSEFLRRASEDSHRSQVTLAEEVEYLQRYLEIQKARFGERLQVSLDIPAELLGAQVPNLLLQPLVENAIKHGIAKRVVGGAVRVAGARQSGNLCLSVYNDCGKLPPDWDVIRCGVGIGNLRTRLQILYGEKSGLQLRRAETDGVEVLVTLPFVEA